MKQELQNRLWFLEKEPQFIPPAILLVFLTVVYYTDPFISSFIKPETRSSLLTVAIVSTAALLIERAVERGFRTVEDFSTYEQSSTLEKATKSAILLSIAIVAYNRPRIEMQFSASVL